MHNISELPFGLWCFSFEALWSQCHLPGFFLTLFIIVPDTSVQLNIQTVHSPFSFFFQLEHEYVWDLQRFTQAQLRAVPQQWQRDHEELLARAQVTLQEAKHAHQEELELHRDRQNQQNVYLHLREKVSASFIPLSLQLLHFWDTLKSTYGARIYVFLIYIQYMLYS